MSTCFVSTIPRVQWSCKPRGPNLALCLDVPMLKNNIDYLSWLVVWNHGILWFSIQLEISEHPNWRFVHDFSELNHQPVSQLQKKTAWSSESHLYGWWNHLWAATWLTWRKMKHDNPKKTAQNQSGTKVFGKITPQAVRWQKLNPPARPKSAKLHGCRASCHGTGVAVRNCHSISDLPSKCPQVLIRVCLKVGKPVIYWLK
jgi:hypothetical protein